MSDRPRGSCSVCKHPARQAIDEAILRAEGCRRIGEQYGISKSSVFDHGKRHVAREGELAAAVSGESLIQRLEQIELHARRILSKTERGGDYRSAIGALREMRGVVDSIARITGAIRDRAEVNVQVNLSEEVSIRAAMIYLERRGWKLIPPLETRALPAAEPGAPADA